MSAPGPVSEVLEAKLRQRVREQTILVWLDTDGHYTSFVEGLRARASELPFDVRAYRGSFLKLLFELEDVAAGVDPSPVVVHMPGFTEESIKTTPVFELYKAGKRYRKALDTLVKDAAAGRLPPESIEAFLAEGALSLEGADAWLSAQLKSGGSVDAQLGALSVEHLVDDLLQNGPLSRRVAAGRPDQEALIEHARARLGIPEGWREETLPPRLSSTSTTRGEDVAFFMASWALLVEFVDDLRNVPEDDRLRGAQRVAKGSVQVCRGLTSHLRERQTYFYERWADEVEAWFPRVAAELRAEDLGKVDTFRFEEDTILLAALRSLEEGAWEPALTWAKARAGDGSFWTDRHPPRRAAWGLILEAAALGRAIATAGASLKARSLDEAIDAYVARGAPVDRAHRTLEQRRLALLYPQLPHFLRLRAALDELRRRWREWADAWAIELNGLCREHGFLPSPERQQRTLFDDVVRPLTRESGITAYFVVDALRFEMAQELVPELEAAQRTTVLLQARFAELPTVTEVGMNVLAPVVDKGKLQPEVSGDEIKGFQAGSFRVHDPATRQKAMAARVGGRKCPWLGLQEVLSRDAVSLKQAIAGAELVVVHSTEIDDAGESGAGLSTFSQVLQQLQAAWRLLREAGAERFVITSDHGFLLLAGGGQDKPAQRHGRKIDPSRRHVLAPAGAGADHAGEARVAFRDLGYEGCDGFVMFPESTAVFDTGNKPQSFVHGGNSLQERVIPVLTVRHRARPGAHTTKYAVRLEALDDVMGTHCLSGVVEVTDRMALDFGGCQEVELALRPAGRSDVVLKVIDVQKARRRDGVIVVQVGERFEVFFGRRTRLRVAA
jgi:hypothetical protein